MAEQETVVLPADPPVEAPVEKPPEPGAPPEPAPAEEPKVEDGEKPPEPEASAFEKLIEGLTDPDEIEAVRERLGEKLPEDRRQPKVDAAKADAESVVLAEQRRRETVRQHETTRDSAVARLNGHLKAVRQRAAADDPGDPKFATLPEDYDPDLLTTAINEIASSQSALDNNELRETMATAVTSRIEKHGGALSNERFKEIVAAVAEGKVDHGIVGAYLDEYGERRYAEGLAAGEAKAQAKDTAWRKAETAAVRAELMREREGEPDEGVSRATGSLTREQLRKMTPREIAQIPLEELQRAQSAVA